MKCKILHESKGRLRIHIPQGRMTLAQADILEAYLLQLSCVTDAKVYDRTCDAVIFYHGQRDAVLTALATFRYQRAQALAPEHSGRALNREYQDKLFFTLCRRVINRTIMPLPIRTALTLCRSVRYLWAGLRCLRKGHIQVPVLDATAITVSLLRRDFKTAGGCEGVHREQSQQQQMRWHLEGLWRRGSSQGAICTVQALYRYLL